MIIVNATLKGENAYDITIGGTATYRVSAFDLSSAIDRVADYIEKHKSKGLFIDELSLKIMAKCSPYQTAEEFARNYNFTHCGTNGIYLEITSVKGVKI